MSACRVKAQRHRRHEHRTNQPPCPTCKRTVTVCWNAFGYECAHCLAQRSAAYREWRARNPEQLILT